MIRLWDWFRADDTIVSVRDLDIEGLRARGKRAILFDLDNTLEPGRPKVLHPTIQEFLKELMSRGMRVGVLSNRRYLSDEEQQALRIEGIPMVFHAGKPRRCGYRKLLQLLGTTVEEAVFVGDRRITDVFGARRMGMACIRVLQPLLS